ncbi:MAG: 4'-phosphopantetheinyl transferase superfamily protein [Pseudobutyrivibrio sp.]|nr:4'-phosphopantetheinyl transferase superfamily protein [Pseudobutyrivibrio sp.]
MNEKIYLMKNTSKTWQPEHDKLLKYVSPERQIKIDRYKFDSDKVNSLYAALLSRLGITRLLECSNSDLIFDYKENHKPVLNTSCHPNAAAIDFNFSHTKGAVIAGITTDESIGVDIEKIAEPPYDVMRLVFHPSEIEYVNSFSGEAKSTAFYQIWTKKEAYTKCLGLGLAADLCSINTLEAPINSVIETWADDDFMCSVCVIPKES